ncbi:MAG: PaaI family thioesterase [Myxococcales bacterium]|nr:MAG: PaaI family thioesterase [Myxococcales bacterium]
MGGKRTRTIQFDDPAAAAATTMGKSGLELLRALIESQVPAAPIQLTLGMELTEVSDGFAKLELEPGEHLYGSFGVVHGGVTGTLLDGAMGAAVLTTLDAKTGCSTVTLSVHFTRAITTRMPRVVVEGWVVHRGSRLVTAEARLKDAQGRLIAHGSGTYALTERAQS